MRLLGGDGWMALTCSDEVHMLFSPTRGSSSIAETVDDSHAT